MKIINHAAVIELLQQRAKLQQVLQGFNTADTIKIGDDPKAQVELPIADIREKVTAVIALEVAAIEEKLELYGLKVIES